jgi:putative pyruvate formate lyase activating enzyme
MHAQAGDLQVDEEGLALRGLIVRHLVMPGMLDDARAIVTFLAGLSRDLYLNLMDQYFPAWKVVSAERYEAINRPVTGDEYAAAQAAARAAGLWRLDFRWRQPRRAVGARRWGPHRVGIEP